ncbi:MAG: hypothetical protein FJ405_13195 [Verrucomicrobia bacterium]|nr:hypothetical protein [Verrucomicrobiota bacterium]
MSPEFKPLSPSSLGQHKSSGFVPKVLPPPGSGGSAPGPSSLPTQAGQTSSTACAPSVEVQQSGDGVVGLIVRCSCGEVIQIQCKTEAG